MPQHSETKNDKVVFFANVTNEALRTKFTTIHEAYDEMQKLSLSNLKHNGNGKQIQHLQEKAENNRRESFRNIAGFALMIASLNDETLDLFLNEGTNVQKVIDEHGNKKAQDIKDEYIKTVIVEYPQSKRLSAKGPLKRASAFFSMLEFEKNLRNINNKEITEKEKRKVDSKLSDYRKMSPHSTQSTRADVKIGTAVLYPMMAIAHGYKVDEADEGFVAFMKKEYDVDVTAIIEEEKEKNARNNKQNDNPVVDIIFPDEEININAGEGTEEKEKNKRERIKIYVTEALAKEMETNKEIAKNQEFIKYGKEKFLSAKEYNYKNLADYIYYFYDQINGVATGGTASQPFANADKPEKVKDIFESLEPEIQDSVIQETYAPETLQSMIEHYNELNREQQKIVKKISFRAPAEVGKAIKERKKQKEEQKQTNKAIRRVYSLSKQMSDNGRSND